MCRKLFPSPRSSWRIYGEKTRKQIIYNQSAYVKCDYAYAHHQFKKSFFLEWEIRVVQHRNRLLPRPRTILVMVSAVLNHQERPERRTNPKELVSELWQKSKTINEAAFRTLNFELYMKPNKPIMIFGVATMTFITSYFAYTQATTGTEREDRRPKKLCPQLTIAQN